MEMATGSTSFSTELLSNSAANYSATVRRTTSGNDKQGWSSLGILHAYTTGLSDLKYAAGEEEPANSLSNPKVPGKLKGSWLPKLVILPPKILRIIGSTCDIMMKEKIMKTRCPFSSP